MEVLGEILRGGAETAALAGAPVLGGHSIDDPEPKYGMAVTGLVHPDRILRNVGARPGDQLLLTKPLGSGILTTAIKRGTATPEQIAGVTAVMAELNRAAGEVLAASGAVSRPHRRDRLRPARARLGDGRGLEGGPRTSTPRAIPVQPDAVLLAERDVVPGGSKANLAWVSPHVRFDAAVPLPLRVVLADAQTNGGLLAAVQPDRFSDGDAAARRPGRRGGPHRRGACGGDAAAGRRDSVPDVARGVPDVPGPADRPLPGSGPLP